MHAISLPLTVIATLLAFPKISTSLPQSAPQSDQPQPQSQFPALSQTQTALHYAPCNPETDTYGCDNRLFLMCVFGENSQSQGPTWVAIRTCETVCVEEQQAKDFCWYNKVDPTTGMSPEPKEPWTATLPTMTDVAETSTVDYGWEDATTTEAGYEPTTTTEPDYEPTTTMDDYGASPKPTAQPYPPEEPDYTGEKAKRQILFTVTVTDSDNVEATETLDWSVPTDWAAETDVFEWPIPNQTIDWVQPTDTNDWEGPTETFDWPAPTEILPSPTTSFEWSIPTITQPPPTPVGLEGYRCDIQSAILCDATVLLMCDGERWKAVGPCDCNSPEWVPWCE